MESVLNLIALNLHYKNIKKVETRIVAFENINGSKFLFKIMHKINSIGPVNPNGFDDIAEAILNEEEKPSKLEEKEEIKRVIIPQPPNVIQNLDRYVILEGRDYGNYSYPDLLVSMDKTYTKMSWYESHALPLREDSYMPTIRQFVDFLNLLRSRKAFDGRGNLLGKTACETLFDEIAARSGASRSEWLDAKFSRKGLTKRRCITYHKILASGTLEEVTEPLEKCLAWSRKPGIDINFWLDNPTPQGMPRSNAPDGDIHYLRPKNGRVAIFTATIDKVIFNCKEDPHLLGYWIGVRPVRLK